MPLNEASNMSTKGTDVIETLENDAVLNVTNDRPDPHMELAWQNGQVMIQSQPNNTTESATVRPTTMGSVSDHFPFPVTSNDTEISHWFDYHISETTSDDFTDQILHDLSRTNFNDLSLENILPSKERAGSFNRITVEESMEDDHVIPIDSVCKPSSSICAFTSLRLQKLSNGSANFSHIRSLGGGGSSNELTKLDNDDGFVDSDMVGYQNAATTTTTTYPVNPTEMGYLKKQSDGENVGENHVERVVAVSSVCSGSGGSDLKRKSLENGDSDVRSEENESESASVRQGCSTVRKGAKRSRSAEVHNLSERRRRDRINEKMRALQELIPNCNKVDKASMLDEAIEYLKALQNQVQMLLVGSGMYIPHMALPHGLPHVNTGLAMNMGVGLGGIGYGMNMLNSLHFHGQPQVGGQPFHGQPQIGQPIHGQQQQFGIQQIPILADSTIQGLQSSGLTVGHPCPPGAVTLKIPTESNLIVSVTQASFQTSNESIARVRSHDRSQTPNASETEAGTPDQRAKHR